MEQASEKLYHVFYSRVKSAQFVLKSGESACFVAGIYYTLNDKIADELREEVAAGHPHIYQEAGKETATAAELDPMADLKKRIIEEYIAKQAAEAGTADMGNSEQGKLNVVDTDVIKEAAAGSDSPAGSTGVAIDITKLGKK